MTLLPRRVWSVIGTLMSPSLRFCSRAILKSSINRVGVPSRHYYYVHRYTGMFQSVPAYRYRGFSSNTTPESSPDGFYVQFWVGGQYFLLKCITSFFQTLSRSSQTENMLHPEKTLILSPSLWKDSILSKTRPVSLFCCSLQVVTIIKLVI